ncbi:hypothetical protein CLCR_08640 [Cladophialophora carrionii]|uniref:Uncharacterized protein n=1 Tax=Cladophialophora carrionii TaxID=86049 RepID=A0A1C1CV52_9EURO|nr:hypothetical protein CLCR_08640 [Cladophialophora carrionii]
MQWQKTPPAAPYGQQTRVPTPQPNFPLSVPFATPHNAAPEEPQSVAPCASQSTVATMKQEFEQAMHEMRKQVEELSVTSTSQGRLRANPFSISGPSNAGAAQPSGEALPAQQHQDASAQGSVQGTAAPAPASTATVIPALNYGARKFAEQPSAAPAMTRANFPVIPQGQKPDLKVQKLSYSGAALKPPPRMSRPKLSLATSMPDPPCSLSNPHVWPQDHYPVTQHAVETPRIKEFPGCHCSCGGKHPVGICQSARQMVEVWRKKGDGTGNTGGLHAAKTVTLPRTAGSANGETVLTTPFSQRNTCKRMRSTSGHGRGILSWFPSQSTITSPTCDHVRKNSNGLPYGLVNVAKGVQWSINWVVADDWNEKNKNKPGRKVLPFSSYDPRIHKPYDPWPATTDEGSQTDI